MSKRIYQRLYGSKAPVYQFKFWVYSQRRQLIDGIEDVTKRNYNADIFLPPTSQTEEELMEKFDIEISDMKSVIPTKDSKVYFTQNCTISRRKFTDKFHTVRNIDNADILVVSDINNKPRYYVYAWKIAVFVKHDPDNESTPETYIWFKPNELLVNVDDAVLADPSIGDNLMDYLNKYVPYHKYFIMDIKTQDELNKFKCCYFDNAVFYENRKDWRIEARDHLDKPVVTESSLLNLLKNDYTGFTKEKIDGIINNINSPDIETRKYGLRVLASLDYHNHLYLSWYIISKNYTKIKSCGNLPRDVTFMCKSIEKYFNSDIEHKPSKLELMLLRDYFIKDFINRINSTIKALKNSYGYDINDVLDIKLTPKEISIDDSLA